MVAPVAEPVVPAALSVAPEPLSVVGAASAALAAESGGGASLMFVSVRAHTTDATIAYGLPCRASSAISSRSRACACTAPSRLIT